MRQAEHLHEIGHRAFAAVVLPVGVGDEAHRSIEREVGSNRGLLRRIERQYRLNAHQNIENEKAAGVEQQHADRVGHGVLFVAFVDAGDFIDRTFNWPQNRRKKCALAVENAGHIGAEQRCDRDEYRAIQENLDPADGGHSGRSFKSARV